MDVFQVFPKYKEVTVHKKQKLYVLLGAGLLLLCAGLLYLTAVYGEGPRQEVNVLVLIWGAVALGAVVVLRRVSGKKAAALVVIGTILLSVLAIAAPGRWTWSTDQYRYRWDGSVSASGVNPYQYTDTDPALSALRTPWLWPSKSVCEGPTLQKSYPCSRLNHEGANTAYPPVAEAFFLIAHVLPGPSEEERMQMYAAFFSVLLVVLLVCTLLRLGAPPAYAALYGWSPAHGLEAALDGHVDAMGVLLALGGTLLALSASSVGRYFANKTTPVLARFTFLQKPNFYLMLAAVLIALAVSTKFYFGVVLLLFPIWRYLAMWLVAGGVFLLTYLPFLINSPSTLLGYLPTYFGSEGYATGERFILISAIIPSPYSTVVAATLCLLFAVMVQFKKMSILLFLGLFFLIISPVQTWYTLLLLVFMVLYRRPEFMGVVLASYPVYADPFSNRPLTGLVTYGIAAVVVGVGYLLRHQASARESILSAKQKVILKEN